MITSLQNPLIKQMRKLQQVKHRRQQGKLLLEGTHLLQSAWEQNWSFEIVCYTDRWQAKYPQLWQQIQGRTVRLEQVSPEVLQATATTVHPDGVVAVVSRPATPALPIQTLGLALETIQDPGNLGTLIRTAVATQVEGLLLNQQCADLESPKVLRASAGAWFHLPQRATDTFITVLQTYQQQGMQLVATVPHASQTFWQVDYRQPTLILIGNEGAGLSQPVLDLADHQVNIPIAQGVESLNAAIAAALLLYEVRRQRDGKPT
ncbi:RNA methyltransferase [Acaryochloris sp. CCMEE 5410]|uniref:TrmH family RNA methyltransferase n=1 Tax=Acaryochloris sp. CCMEE 5410 TaxID=310037 RepID=UPI000248445A|nr:RNA methyltransferase [Acaryochloris sp. CCMEE 5410]